MELKPCPFCGGKALSKCCGAYDYGQYQHYIQCENCEVSTPKFQTRPDGSMRPEEYAASIWNRRVE